MSTSFRRVEVQFKFRKTRNIINQAQLGRVSISFCEPFAADVEVKLVLDVNNAVLVGIHHLEEVVVLSLCDLHLGDLLNGTLELCLTEENISKLSCFQPPQSPDFLSTKMIFQIIDIGEEVLEEVEALGGAGVCREVVVSLESKILFLSTRKEV